ncbi:MAG: 50S ribosomal protein L19 [Candidatus Hydrogenedentota bacterium]
MNLLEKFSRGECKTPDQVPQFAVGDTVRVHFRIVEGEKERIQVFEGVVISRTGGEGPAGKFTVRRVAFNEGVERVFPLHSPRVEKVEVTREGKVRRAKLYYLRERAGKAARVKRRERSAAEREAAAQKNQAARSAKSKADATE